MNIIYELIIIVAIAIFFTFYAALLLCHGIAKHHYIVYNGLEKENYVLKKSKIFLLPAFAATWNWKTGIIRKDTFWGIISVYIYFLCFFVADLVFYLVTGSDMVIAKPFAFVIPVVIPVFVLPLLRVVLIIRRNRKEHSSQS